MPPPPPPPTSALIYADGMGSGSGAMNSPEEYFAFVIYHHDKAHGALDIVFAQCVRFTQFQCTFTFGAKREPQSAHSAQ